jgi:hypothetical protein
LVKLVKGFGSFNKVVEYKNPISFNPAFNWSLSIQASQKVITSKFWKLRREAKYFGMRWRRSGWPSEKSWVWRRKMFHWERVRRGRWRMEEGEEEEEEEEEDEEEEEEEEEEEGRGVWVGHRRRVGFGGGGRCSTVKV